MVVFRSYEFLSGAQGAITNRCFYFERFIFVVYLESGVDMMFWLMGKKTSLF
jgi:hypothetical protein